MNKTLLKDTIKQAEVIEKKSARRKLDTASFVRQAIENACTTPERLDMLDERILNGKTFRWSQAFLRNSKKWIAEKTCSCPTSESRRLSWLGHYDNVVAELAVIGSTPLEVFALAARTVAKEKPEVFGDLQDIAAHNRKLAELKAEYEANLKLIENGYVADDLIVGPADSEGRARVSFRLTDGVVTIGPHSGQHLIEYLRTHPSIKL